MQICDFDRKQGASWKDVVVRARIFIFPGIFTNRKRNDYRTFGILIGNIENPHLKNRVQKSKIYPRAAISRVSSIFRASAKFESRDSPLTRFV